MVDLEHHSMPFDLQCSALSRRLSASDIAFDTLEARRWDRSFVAQLTIVQREGLHLGVPRVVTAVRAGLRSIPKNKPLARIHY